MSIPYEKIAVGDLGQQLPEVMFEVTHNRNRILLTYQGVPMAQIVPMEDAKALDEYDRKIREEMQKEAAKHSFFVNEPTTPVEDLNTLLDKDLKKRPERKARMKKRANWAPFAKQMVSYLKRLRTQRSK